jgi:hypothetical protein
VGVAGAVLCPVQGQEGKGRKFAILVGVRDYSSSKLDPLKYTENDAEELARVLKEQGGFGVRVLTTSRGAKDRQFAPTLANIQTSIKALLRGRKRDDTVLIALAGHGIQAQVKGKDESFFCPSDAQFSDTSTHLSLAKLFADLDACDAGVKLLLVDACRNDPNLGRNVNLDHLRPPRGIAALFSCKGGERAFESPKLGTGHGVFFHHVIEGLKGEAKNKRGEVTWSRLADYVTEAVSEDVPKLIGKGAKQTPELKVNLTGRSPVLVQVAKAEVVREQPKQSTGKPVGKPAGKAAAKTISPPAAAPPPTAAPGSEFFPDFAKSAGGTGPKLAPKMRPRPPLRPSRPASSDTIRLGIWLPTYLVGPDLDALKGLQETMKASNTEVAAVEYRNENRSVRGALAILRNVPSDKRFSSDELKHLPDQRSVDVIVILGSPEGAEAEMKAAIKKCLQGGKDVLLLPRRKVDVPLWAGILRSPDLVALTKKTGRLILLRHEREQFPSAFKAIRTRSSEAIPEAPPEAPPPRIAR